MELTNQVITQVKMKIKIILTIKLISNKVMNNNLKFQWPHHIPKSKPADFFQARTITSVVKAKSKCKFVPPFLAGSLHKKSVIDILQEQASKKLKTASKSSKSKPVSKAKRTKSNVTKKQPVTKNSKSLSNKVKES